MEAGLSILSEHSTAPSRTVHCDAVTKSSPLPLAVRSILETRAFSRRFDAVPLDLAPIEDLLPGLECPKGNVPFLVDESSLENMRLSVDALLDHRKKLITKTIDRRRPRRQIFILGAGPAGLMAAVQLSLRDHNVVVCEQREEYARNRHIGVYKEVAHLMAGLGMPESMTYDFSQYRGKRGIMLADIQTFLHAIALKLGVIIYTGAVPRLIDAQTLARGEIELQRASKPGSTAASAAGLTRWQHDTVSRAASGVTIRFDAILEASGGRSGLRETLVGKENVVSLHEIGLEAAKADPSLKSYFDDPEDHTAEYVESGYGCPAGLLPRFAAALLSGDRCEIPSEIPCFVSNIDASVFKLPMHQTEHSLGLASRIGDRDLKIPHDWVVIECRRADQSLSRYHVEGPLPQTFEYGGRHLATRDVLENLNPVSLLIRVLQAMGVPFDAIDRRQLVDFYAAEASRADASDVASLWTGTFRGVRLGTLGRPVWRGLVPGSDWMEYGIIGEALQNAWYRFGVGVDDAFRGAEYFAAGFDLAPDARIEGACRFERIVRARSVQILYHLYEVGHNKDLAMLGSVLTDCHMEEQHTEDVAEARLRDASRDGEEMLATEADLGLDDPDCLLSVALDDARANCCQRILQSAGSSWTEHSKKSSASNWRLSAWAEVESRLPKPHRLLLAPLFQRTEPTAGHFDPRLRQERLIELASGRYRWVTPWMRACAIRLLRLTDPAAISALKAAAMEADPLIAEAAETALAALPDRTAHSAGTRTSIFEKVLLLKSVSIFASIPHGVLVSVAALMSERWLSAGETIFDKGDFGDSMYVIGAGRVRVCDGVRTIREMCSREFFGELALLDSEPRAARVVAVEPALVFRLAQDAFYALMSEQPVIARAINRELCKKVRRA